jgi:4-hydroxy-tetrahydrodipicolinate synthase
VLAGSGEDFALLGGDDAFLFPLMLMGARGAIAASANVCTRRFVEMIDGGLRLDVEEGRGNAEALLPVVQALFAEPRPAVIKALLHAQGRIPTAAVRMPLADASPQAAARALEACQRVDR